MFRIEDGRNLFFQWDIDRRIIISDPTVDNVHFCNRTDDCSLVVKVYEEDGKRLADVPNILLQESWPIHVYAYCGSRYTKQEAIYKVNPRSKPADYVYTETEVATWSKLEQRMDNIENFVSDESISQAIDDFLMRNPIEIPEEYITETELEAKGYLTEHQSLKGYATEKYVNDSINNMNLSAYAKKTDIPTKVSELENDKGYLTTHQNLSAYAKKTEIPTKVSELENDKGYLTKHQDLSNYAKKSEIPTVPTKVSAFTNDAGYLTEHQSLEGYAKVEDIPDVSGYQTEEQVIALIKEHGGDILIASEEVGF